MMKKRLELRADSAGDSSGHNDSNSPGQSLSSAFIQSIISNSGVTKTGPLTGDKESHRHHDGQKWNITNSAQNIVSALVDPSKQYDYAFRREWSNAFSSGPSGIPSSKLLKSVSMTKKDAELRSKLRDYLAKLEERRIIKQKELHNKVSQDEQISSTTGNDSKTENGIKKVPDLFMRDQLDLSDLKTFTSIFDLLVQDELRDPESHNEHTKETNSSITYNKYAFNKFQLRQLQKQFTDYLDEIEENLAGQISNRSGDFFQVMSSVDSVMDEVSLAIKSVTSLRKKCATLNNALILPNLRNIQLTKSRNNANEVLVRLNNIEKLCKVQSKIQLLLSSSDFVGALNLIAKSRRLLENELVGVVCLRHLESQLHEIERVIGTMMQQEFITLITSEWNRPVPPTQNGYAMDPDNNSHEAKLFEHERVLSIVQGMIRINRLNFGEYFQQEARIAISTCVKQTLIEFLSDEDDCIGSDDKVSHDVYKTVQLINYTRWVAMIKIVFINLLSILKRIKIVYKVILSSLNQVESYLSDANNPNISNSTLSSSEEVIIPEIFQMIDADVKQSTLNSVRQGKNGLMTSFQAVCNFAIHLTVNLIECRIKESNFDKLLATEFINLSKLIEDFTRVFSDICDRDQLILRSLLQTQADKFVNKFHDERTKRIKSNLDIEQWKMVEEIPEDFQQLITNIVDDGIPMWQCLEADKIKEYQQQQSGRALKNSNSQSSTHANNDVKDVCDAQQRKIESSKQEQVQKKSGRSFVVANKQNYVIVNSAINLVRTILDYCRCANDIKFLSSEILARLFELLHLYNSTTYQLASSYLRAGTLQVGGLKTITARNLIVSQRSLKLILLVLPSILQHFERLLPEDHNSMLKRFDEISLTYKDHAGKIPERITSRVKNVINKSLDMWEPKPPVPSAQFCAVSQHLMMLHDNIQDAMPHDELKELFSKIHKTFKDVLRSHLIRLKIANDSGPQQWLVTQELAFYKMNAGKLTVFKSMELDFDDLWSKLDAAHNNAHNVS